MEKFIVIEGLEGAGKSTVIKEVSQYFDKCLSNSHIVTREPGGTTIAEDIRSLLIRKYDHEVLYPDAELLLMYASRLQHYHHLIYPKLMNGDWVISDRFNWSSMAYQGGGRKIDLQQILSLDRLFLSMCQPGLIIYLDINPELGLNRIQSRLKLDRFEEEELSFFKGVRSVYLKLCKLNTNAFLIDASQEKHKVIENVLKVISNYANRVKINKKIVD